MGFLFYWYWRYPKWISERKFWSIMCRRFLYVRFKPEYYYFFLPLMLRNLCVAFAPVLVQFAGLQVILVAMLCMIYGGYQTWHQPWRAWVVNFLDMLLSFIFVVMPSPGTHAISILLKAGEGGRLEGGRACPTDLRSKECLTGSYSGTPIVFDTFQRSGGV